MADYLGHRPKGYEGQGDSCLPKIARQLCQALSAVQRGLPYDTLRLPSRMLGDLAGILGDSAEDLLAGMGIGAAYERFNVELFGTPLPLTSAGSGSGLSADRFRHFLWVLYPTLLDGLVISPTHQDLHRVADAASKFLSDAFADVPTESGVKAFLGSPNDHGWDMKRKLV
jgi:hypothetical protein